MENEMKISIKLIKDESELLDSTAHCLEIRPEELAKATLSEALSRDKEDFRKAAEYVIRKNDALYQRLA